MIWSKIVGFAATAPSEGRKASNATVRKRPVDWHALSMTERLRALSPMLRFAVYIFGALLLFILALGAGALAALVLGWQFYAAPYDSVGGSASDGTTFETTAPKPENTTIKRSSDTNPSKDKLYEVSFVHRATDDNSRGDYTYISDPSINGKPNAIVLVSPSPDRVGGEPADYGHNIGVWYEGRAGKWAIFNQDLAAVPAGAAFKVTIPKEPAGFVHYAKPQDTEGFYTYVDNKRTNGEPDAVRSVTQNWNPGGGRGVYNDHPIDTRYDADREVWAVYNRDG
ncbi:MAG TPA: hypothetical protein VFY59_17350, partial [Rubrobacter sp.]|nr:hypothetical protein [Rubrobacter sp.]